MRRELFKKKDLFSQIFGLTVEPAENNSISTKVRFNNPSIINNNPEFDFLISTSGWALPRTLELLSSLNDQMELLIDEINQELNK